MGAAHELTWLTALTQVDRILDRVGRNGITCHMHSMGPMRERIRGAGKWTKVRRNTAMPCERDRVEVKLATGEVKVGPAGDFVWNMPKKSAGRIVEFRYAP